jgi:FG-GAP-like repeat
MGRIGSSLLCVGLIAGCVLSAAAQSFSRTVVADVNGDGKPDVLVMDTTLNNVAVYLNTGNGALGPGAFFGFLPPTVQFDGAMVVSDRNGDGIPDILIVQSQQIQTLLGDGKGNFSVPSVTPISPIDNISNIVIASCVVAQFHRGNLLRFPGGDQ